jgi:hypothetical protein
VYVTSPSQVGVVDITAALGLKYCHNCLLQLVLLVSLLQQPEATVNAPLAGILKSSLSIVYVYAVVCVSSQLMIYMYVTSPSQVGVVKLLQHLG